MNPARHRFALTFIPLLALLVPLQGHARNPVEAVKALDHDGDGRVSLSEWDKPKKPFQRIDKNGDGYLTAEEFAADWGVPMPGSEEAATPAVIAGCAIPPHPLPIADAHYHILPWQQPDDVCRLMQEHGIKWIGGAGQMQPDALVDRYKARLGEQWRIFGGQRQLSMEFPKAHGHGIIEDADHPAMRELLAMLDKELQSGYFKGIGEVHINTRTSAPRPDWQRKLRANAPGIKALADLAARHRVPLSIHAQWDNDTEQQLAALANHNPQTVILLAHCGTDASASQIRVFLNEHPNVTCDLSSRYDRVKKYPERQIYAGNKLDSAWKSLIEEMPERFTVGVDDVHSEKEYAHVVRAIREGLLANLTPETARRVAHENADRIFGMN